MLEFLIFGLIVLFITFFSIINLRLKNNNLQLALILDKTISDLEFLRKQFNGNSSTESEHLVAFLNETRDIAYRYIEDVHVALLEYQTEIAFDLENPSELSIHRFREAFKKLQKIYPQDIPND